MITTGKEFFYSIQGLTVPKNEVSDLLVEDLNFFVDRVEANIDSLNFLLENHIESFTYEMRIFNDILNSIYAKWMQDTISKILKLASASRISFCQKLLEPFITGAQTLAIDIQMAQNSKVILPKINNSKRDQIESYKDIVSSMRIIFGLLEQSDFDKAFEIALSINELRDSEFYEPFMEGIVTNDIMSLMKLIDKIIALYTGKINSINDIEDTPVKSDGPKKLMIVDDMPEILAVLSKMLKDYFQIYAFSDAREALDFIDRKGRPDLFLLDVDMPEMDGFELAKNIRERDLYRDTPLLFLTGNSARKTVIKSVLYDAKAFIVKPAGKDIILSKLRECAK